MIGWAIGGSILAVFLVVAVARPLTVRTAMGYAWAARKQMIPVVLGLSAITAILGAAEIIEDSAVEGVKESYLSPLNLVDGQVRSWWDGITEDQVEAFLADPRMAPIQDTTGIREGINAVEGPYGLGTDAGQFWAIDPDDYAKFVNFEVLEGSIPGTWSRSDAVVDQRAALDYGVEAGDELVVFIGARPQPFLVEVPVEGTFDAVYPDPLGVTSLANDSVPAQSQLLWSGELAERDTLRADVDADAELLQYRIESPVGTWNEEISEDPDNPSAPDWEWWAYDEEWVGTWEVYLESKPDVVGQEVSYEGTVVHEGERIPDDRIETLTVRAIVDDANTPLSWGGVILVNEEHAEHFFGIEPPVMRLLLDIDDDVNHLTFSRQLEDAAQANFENAWAVDFHQEVAELTREIELFVGPTFAAFGMMSIIAGIILVIVLISLIVEERRGVLGALRAVGGTRGQVQTMVLTELAIVALASVLFGLLFAMAFGGSVIGLMQSIMESDVDAVVYTVKLPSLLDAGGIAFAIILAAGWFGARNALKAGPIELLRNQPAPEKPRRAWLGRLAWISFAFFLTAVMALLHPWFALLIGGTAVVITLAVALAALLRWKYVVDIAMLALFAIILVTMLAQGDAINDRLYDYDDGGGWRDDILPMLYPLQALILVGLGAALLVRSKLVHLGLVAMLRGPLRSMGEMATGNLRDRPGRQGAILAVFAVSILMIIMMGLMFQSFGPTVADDDGGHPVMGQTRFSIGDPELYLEDNPPHSGADPFAMAASTTWAPTADRWNNFGIDMGDEYPERPWAWGPGDVGVLLTTDLANTLEYDAVRLAPGIETWEEAVQRTRSDPNTLIFGGAPEFWVYNEDQDQSYNVPLSFDMDLVRIPDENGFKQPITVAAILPEAGGFSIMVGPQWFDDIHDTDRDGTRLWFAPGEGVSSEELAIEVGSAFRSAGMQVYDIEEEAREEQRVALTIQTIIGLFMGMGILVGMLSLGLIAQRTLHQRQGALSVLRAIGATKERVMAGFVVEQTFVVVLAVLLGTIVGLVTGGAMLTALDEGIRLRVDAVFMVSVLGATLLGGLFVGVVPALRLRRMRIADALRYE